MKILALDSSGLTASVAVVSDQELIAEYTVNYEKTHSQTLMPMLQEAAGRIGLDLQSVDAIAVANGPGSFTGLRIGVATVKGLALALDKPVIAIPTVDALAYNLAGASGLVCPLMNARRNQVYTGIYRFADGKMEIVKEQCALALDEILDELEQMHEPVTFLGDGVPVFRDQIEQRKLNHRYAPVHLALQRGGSVGALALEYAKEGKQIHADALSPDYLRMSQAERERKEAMEKQQEIKS